MQVQSARIPVLRSYERALEHFEKVAPYKRGSVKGLKPIGANRRYQQCLIDKVEGTEVVMAVLYKSDLVAFYPNGQVHVSLCKYDSSTTRGFIEAVTGYPCFTRSRSTYLSVGGKDYAFHDEVTPLIIADGVVVNPKQELIYKINRKAMNEKREEFAPFLNYVRDMGAVMDMIKDSEIHPSVKARALVLPTSAVRYYHGNERPLEGLKLFLYDVKHACVTNNLEEFYIKFQQLAMSALRYDYYRQGYRGELAREGFAAIGKPMVEFFDEVLKYLYKNDLFVTELAPIGSSKANANRKYFA
jgi:hypothetical protein